MELLLAGGGRLTRSPLHYLYPYGAAWCLGFFDNAYSSTVLGANLMLDTVVTVRGLGVGALGAGGLGTHPRTIGRARSED